MKNTYIASYFPLLSITIFSLSISVRIEWTLIDFLKRIGIYKGLLEFFSEGGIRVSLLIMLSIVLFMVLSALKLIANTINELSLLFFSKDSSGESLTKARAGSIIFFIGSIASFFCVFSYLLLGAVFAVTTLVYFVYFVHAISLHLSTAGIIAIILFQVTIWSFCLTSVLFLSIKMYNALLASLPI